MRDKSPISDIVSLGKTVKQEACPVLMWTS